EIPFQCGKCGKAFALPADLVNHIRLHTVPSSSLLYTYKPECGNAFALPADLVNHIRLHTAFALPADLVNHIRLHTVPPSSSSSSSSSKFIRASNP
ncbi:hypothetical protein T484DRAFT_1865876, partial [Baffinella frigidus]